MGIEFAGIARQVVKLVSYTVTKFWDIIEMFVHILSVCPQQNYFFLFSFFAWFGMSLKCMGESFLLSKDEPLTPGIDGGTALWIFRNTAQNTKIDQTSANIGPLKSNFYLVSPPPPCPLCTGGNFPRTTEPSALGKKLRYTGEHDKGVNLIPPIWYRPFPIQIWPNALWF